MTVTLAQLSHIKTLMQEIVELEAADDDETPLGGELNIRYTALGHYLVEQKIMRQMLDAVPEEGTFHVVYPFTRSTIEEATLTFQGVTPDGREENFKALPNALMEAIANKVAEYIDIDDFAAAAEDLVNRDGTINEDQRCTWDENCK